MRFGFNFSKIAVSLLSFSVLVMSAACGEHPATPAVAPKAEIAAKQEPTPTLVPGAPVYDFLGALPWLWIKRRMNITVSA
jgi:hypothetical protein